MGDMEREMVWEEERTEEWYGTLKKRILTLQRKFKKIIFNEKNVSANF